MAKEKQREEPVLLSEKAREVLRNPKAKNTELRDTIVSLIDNLEMLELANHDGSKELKETKEHLDFHHRELLMLGLAKRFNLPPSVLGVHEMEDDEETDVWVSNQLNHWDIAMGVLIGILSSVAILSSIGFVVISLW